MTEYGFPTRPADPAAAKFWEQEMTKVKEHLDSNPPLQGLCSAPAQGADVDPAPVQTTMVGNATTASQAPYTSNNWGGMWNNGGGPATYYSISGTFKQPTFVSYCTSTSSHNNWVGLGGYSGRPLMQIGTDFPLDHLNQDRAWWQTVNGPGTSPIQILSGFAVSAGTAYTPEVSYDSSNQTATFRITDQNGNTAGFVLQGWYIGSEYYPASYWYYGDPAEAVEERISNGQGWYFPFTKTSAPTPWGNIQVNGQNSLNYPWQEIDMWNGSVSSDLLDYPDFPSGSTFTMVNRWWNCD